MIQTVVHLVSGDLWGGAENQVWQLVDRQRRRSDLSVHVIILNEGQLFDQLSDVGVDVKLLKESELGFPQLVKGSHRYIRDLVRAGNKVVLHAHRRKENLIAVLIGFVLDVRLVRTLHGANEHTSSESLGKKLGRQVEKRLLLARIDAHVAVSLPLAKALTIEGFSEENVRVIRNGIDFVRLDEEAKRWQTSTLESYRAAEELEVRYRIGIVGRLVPVKRQDLFIELASDLWNKGVRQFEYFIVGDGPLEHELKELAAKSPARAMIHFTGFERHVIPIIAALDAVMILSDHEGLPLTLLESIGLGTKVFGHDVGGVGEILRAYPKLLLKEPLVDTSGKALLELTRQDQELERQFENLRVRVRQDLSIEQTEQNYFALYADVGKF